VKLRVLRLFTTEDTAARQGRKMGHMIWYDVASARLSNLGTSGRSLFTTEDTGARPGRMGEFLGIIG
jgi:hypothetical protein